MSDLVLRYSGGAFNDASDQSLGGSMSLTVVPNNKLNNLFDDATDRNRKKTFTDYRCLYIQNIHPTETAYTLQASILSETDDGASFYIGTLQRNETQKVVISEESSISSGSFKLTLKEETTASIAWNSNLTIMGASIQLALQNLSVVNTVTVAGSSANDEREFEIEFTGLDAKKLFPFLEVAENLLNAGSITIESIQRGTPVNDPAADIGFANQAPTYVTFVDIDNLISLGSLDPGEATYIWFKREITKDVSDTLLVDSLVLYLSCLS